MSTYLKICWENSGSIRIMQEYRMHYMKTSTQFWSHLAQFFSELETFQTKVVEKIKTHILSSIAFFRKSFRLWKNVGKYCRVGQALSSMRIACWIPKATNTHSQYVTLITFPQEQWMHEGASMFHHTYLASLDINQNWIWRSSG